MVKIRIKGVKEFDDKDPTKCHEHDFHFVKKVSTFKFEFKLNNLISLNFLLELTGKR